MIGVILCYKGTNFGMMMQAYATVAYLRQSGYVPVVIDYTTIRNKRFSIKMLKWLFNRSVVRSKIKTFRRSQILRKHPEITNAYRIRRRGNIEFINKRMGKIIQIFSMADLKKLEADCDALIVGSDQQWHPAALYSNVNTLMFAEESTRKISYATSFGVAELPRYTMRRAQKFLSRIDYLSVREETGRKIIKELCGREAKVTVDPTLLFTQSEWEALMPESRERLIHDDYILTYFLGSVSWHRQAAVELKKLKKCKIVQIRNLESYCLIDSQYADTIIDARSPEEFLSLIRYSSGVCTDSFHGTIFSLIYHTPFFTFLRYNARDANSRNSRITDLLSTVGLENHIITKLNEIDSMVDAKIDFAEADKIIETHRIKSRDFLQLALSGAEKNR